MPYELKVSTKKRCEMVEITEPIRRAIRTWQGIYSCEFDGPRNRKVWLKARVADGLA